MGWNVYKITNPVARKDYVCNASEIVIGQTDERDYEGDDLLIFQGIKESGCKILKGTKYVKCAGIYDGKPSTFRARIDADNLCHKHHLYDE